MPRRVSNDVALAELNEVWPESVVEMDAQTLRASLQNAGKSDLIPLLRNLKQSGALRGYVRLNDDGTTTHVVARVEEE